jgi:hypothetical protein
MRRLGDVIQAVAVLAIVGLAVAVIDLRVTIVQNQSKINAQDQMYTQQLVSLKENLELQMKVLESIVQRVTAGGFDANRGRALEEAIESLTKRVDAQDVTISQAYQLLFDQVSIKNKKR